MAGDGAGDARSAREDRQRRASAGTGTGMAKTEQTSREARGLKFDAAGKLQRAIGYLWPRMDMAAIDTLDSLSLDIVEGEGRWRHRVECVCRNCREGVRDGMARSTHTGA